MIGPFKRFFGGLMIGIFLSIPLMLSRGELFDSRLSEKMTMLPPLSFDAFAAACLVFLGFTCAWVGAMATRRSLPFSASLSTMETLRRRRKRRQRSYGSRQPQFWLGHSD